MPFQLIPAVEADFSELHRVLTAAFADAPLYNIVFPYFGKTPQQRQIEFDQGTERLLAGHRKDPTSLWYKVIDDSTGEIVGGFQSHIHETNPLKGHPTPELPYWPEGPQRKMASHLLSELYAGPKREMPEPCLFVTHLFTRPDYQGLGVGGIMVDFLIREAESKGLDMYWNSSDKAKEFYEKRGFVTSEKRELSLDMFPDSPDKKLVQGMCMPQCWYAIYRPLGGKVEEMKTALPWELV